MVLRAYLSGLTEAQATGLGVDVLAGGRIHDYRLKYVERVCYDLPIYFQFFETVGRHLIGDEWPEWIWQILNYCFYNSSSSMVESIFINGVRNVVEAFDWGWYEEAVPLESEEGIFLTEFYSEALGEIVHAPPTPFEEDYEQLWREWKNDNDRKWFKLWQTVPMVTREDTEGHLGITPEIQPLRHNERYVGIWGTQILVPHLARLWETSRWIQQTLLPVCEVVENQVPYCPEEYERTSDQDLFAQIPMSNFDTLNSNSSENQALLASAKTNVAATFSDLKTAAKKATGNKRLLAQGCSGAEDVAAFMSPIGTGGGMYSFNGTYWAEGCGRPLFDVHGPMYITHSRFGRIWGATWWKTGGDGMHSGSPANCRNYGCPPAIGAQPGDTVCFCADIEKGGQHHCPSGCDPFIFLIGQNCACCTVLADGSTTCGPAEPPPPPPGCHKYPLPESGWCLFPAITDPNPNDDLCCVENVPPTCPIKGSLYADGEILNDWCYGSPTNPACDCYDYRRGYFDCPPLPYLDPDPCVRDCCKKFTATDFRQIEVHDSLPYLEQIWEQSTVVSQGFFNYFRPSAYPEYPEMPAKSTIDNYFMCTGAGNPADCVASGADPDPGDFYFQFLGGVQMGKQETIKNITPYVE
jgi:hypothetical protein